MQNNIPKDNLFLHLPIHPQDKIIHWYENWSSFVKFMLILVKLSLESLVSAAQDLFCSGNYHLKSLKMWGLSAETWTFWPKPEKAVAKFNSRLSFFCAQLAKQFSQSWRTAVQTEWGKYKTKPKNILFFFFS